MPSVLHRSRLSARGRGLEQSPPMSEWVGPEALPGVVGLDHIGIAVADLDAAVVLHTEVLGLTVRHRETNPEQGVREVMLAAPAADGAGTQLQLLAPLDEQSPVHRFLARRGPGLHHVAYAVRNVLSASDVLLRRGLRLLYDAPRAGTRGSLINFVHPKDTGGVLIELVQAAARNQGQG
jgi:methylmalonyl-CoA/ethylmalonyl-CoA epimerase